MSRWTGLLASTCIAASTFLVLPFATTTSANFTPDPFVPGTPGTTSVYTTNFNGQTAGNAPTGWTGSGWVISNSTQTGANGGSIPIPGATGGYVWHDDTAAVPATITSPLITLAAGSDPYLTFDAHSFFASGSEGNLGFDTDKSFLQINVLNSAGTLLDQIFELGDTDINGAAGWLRYRVRLAPFAGQDVRLQVNFVNGDGNEHDIALDNLSVVTVPVPDGSDRIQELASATYFLPITSAEMTIAHTNINSNIVCAPESGPQQTVTEFTSITVGGTPLDANGDPTPALIIYDHSEDGFGPIDRRTQSTTELWGDADPSNGFPPGHADDLLFPGDVIVLQAIGDPGVSNPSGTPNQSGAQINIFDSTQQYDVNYDAGDRLTSPTGLVITRMGWNDGSSTLLAGAIEVTDTSQWGTLYKMPVGENLTSGGLVPNSFEYVGASIMARTNGTVVTLPGGTTVTLNAGQTYYINGGIQVGATISSTGGPISVDLLAGDRCSTFEGNWYRIDPVRLFDDLYYTPVTGAGVNSTVLLYNPGTSAITVTVFDDTSATVADGSVSVPAGGVARYEVNEPDTGSSFQSANGELFYAVQIYDTSSSTRDWGLSLLGRDQLSPVIQAGLALGVDPTSGDTTLINSPIWITGIWAGTGTPTGGITVCVDWNGNGGTLTIGGNPDLAYDTTTTISSHLDLALLDEALSPPSNDLTGTKAFVCNPANPSDPNLTNWLLAAAWGEDTSGSTGSPTIDVGTTIFNLPTFAIEKSIKLITDDNNNGVTDVGDTVEYALTVTNTSGVPIRANRLRVWDNMPAQLDYLETTTKFTLAPGGAADPETIADDGSGATTAFPLDDADSSNRTFEDGSDEFTDTINDGVWWNRQLLGGEQFVISYRAKILSAPANNVLTNVALVTDGRAFSEDQVSITLPEYASIGDRVWLDEDGDGIQDAGEDGVAGVTVTLTYTPSGGSPVTLTTITDADGGYLFRDLPILPNGTNYTVAITVPNGMVLTAEEDGTRNASVALPSDPLAALPNGALQIQPGEEHVTTDFGLNWVAPANTDGGTGTGAIGDRVWSDADGDGKQDPGEAGIPGVTVRLLTDPDGNGVYDTQLMTTVTDANGKYIFDELAVGAYVVEIVSSTLPAGLTQTGDPDATLDHRSNPIPLAPGDVYVNADFGYKGITNTIGDKVWIDADGDGVVDANEPGIAGVSVVLLDSTGRVVATTTTSATGGYSFTGVPNGTYTVWVNDTDNVLREFAPIFDADGTLNNRTTVTVSGGTNITTADFGYNSPTADPGEGTIGDTVWLDRDNDGVYDAGEGLEGVRLELFDEIGRLVGVTYTNENGQYVFGGLLPTVDGQYEVRVDASTLPAGLTQTVDPDANKDGAATTTLTAGQAVLTLDFAYRPTSPATLSGTIWEDTDADGVLDAPEAARFSGVTVLLTVASTTTIQVTNPANPATTIPVTLTYQRVVGTTTTDASGNYSFTGLMPGTYTVQVTDDANVVGGYWHSDAPAPGTDSQSQNDQGYTVTLAAGGTNTTADFGYYVKPGVVGNTVFSDANGNGVQDSGEAGIPGAVVQLVITYPNVATTTMRVVTDSNGVYTFGNLLLDEDHNGDTTTAGTAEPTFVVSVVSLPAAFATAVSTHPLSPVQTDSTAIGGVTASDLDADNPAGEPAFPGQGVSDLTNDFGYVAQGVIGDYVWEDLDGDGIQEAGEPALSGVTVRLRNSAGTVIATTTTSATGLYSFTGLLPGDYTVEFVAPSGYVFTTANAGANDALDSDASISTGRTGTINLTAGETDNTNDAGLYRPVKIGDRVFNDVDGDGIDDGAASDPGIAGVTVTLYRDSNGDGQITPGTDTVVATTTTSNGTTDVTGDGVVDPAGTYLFGNLAPGTYGVVVSTGTGSPVNGWQNTVDPDATKDAKTTTAFTLTSGQSNLVQDFGFFLPAVIGDTIFYDADKDGVQDAGEPGLVGVTVRLLDSSGTQVGSTVTTAGGQYLFSNLPPGTYTVVVDTTTLPAGFSDAINTADPDGGTASRSTVTVVAGQSKLDQDFGYFDPGSIGDTVYHDVNGNGVQDAGEPGIVGVTVELRNSSGTLIGSQVTGVNGGYLFTNLTDGTYTVSVVTTSLPAAFLPAINSDDPDAPAANKDAPGNSSAIVDLDSAGASLAGVSNLNQDFGYFDPASIGDRVFEDLDNDGVQDAGEPGFANVTVNLLNAGGTVIATTTTDANGNYMFANLAPGTYTVQVVGSTLPAGAVETFEKDATLNNSTTQTVTAGQSVTDVDFGYFRPGSIGDRVWNDADADGIQDAGEVGVAGITVQLRNSAGTVIATTTTDANGNYTFGGLVAGSYSVVFGTTTTGGTSYIFTLQDQGANDAVDSDANRSTGATGAITLANAQQITSVDAGLVVPAVITGVVREDTNGDGAGDVVLSGVSVQLFADTNGDGVPDGGALASTTTNASGVYSFGGLMPGNYVVVETNLSGYTDVSDRDTAPDGDALDANVVVDNRVPVALTVGELDAGNDFVDERKGSIGDRVWNDSDADGIQDAGEPGVAGITVQLFSGGVLVATTTTDATGIYSFAGLSPKDYTVVFGNTAGGVTYLFSPLDQGANDAVDSDANRTTGSTGVVTLLPGQQITSVDAGLVVPAVITGVVREDTNGDGAGDVVLSGVSVQLFADTNGDGVPDGGALASTTTNASGVYSFGGLMPGNYVVVETNLSGYTDVSDRDTAPDGDALDANVVVDNRVPVALTVGELDAGNDFVDERKGSIGDRVWNDSDADGIQDAGEPGVAGITVQLFSGGVLVATTTTDATGIYSFAGLSPKDYTVVFGNTAGGVTYLFSPLDQGANDAVDSDANRTTGSTGVVTLLPGQQITSVDAGLVVPAVITGVVREDTNGDGAGDVVLSGVSVQLFADTNGDGVPDGGALASTTTNASGVYSFGGLMPGNYVVVETNLSGYTDVSDRDTAPDGDALDANVVVDNRVPVALTVGELDAGNDFVDERKASIGDFVWADLDGDGIQDAGEPGIAGTTVTLRNSSGVSLGTTTTDANGLYSFTNLSPGQYQVSFGTTDTAGDRYVISPVDEGANDAVDSDANPATGTTATFTLLPGTSNTTIDAGLQPPGSLGDFVWSDTDADGIQDAGEPGIAGATVTLYRDSNGNGTIEPGVDTQVATTTTNASGGYLFINLPAGSYGIVVVPPASDQWLVSPANAGANDAVDSDINGSGISAPITVGINADVLTLDAGFVPAASIGDRVWQDLDGDGIQDAGEPGVSGVTVNLLNSSGTLIANTTTAANGNYTFSGLYPGGYQIQVVLPAGNIFSPQNAGSNDAVDSDVNSTGRTATVTLVAGQDDTTTDAGLVATGSIGDTVFADLDGDGIQDTGDIGLPGVTVELLNSAGAVVATTTTDANGNYLFDDLAPGDYSVQFGNTAGGNTYLYSPANQGGNDAVDSDANQTTGRTGTITVLPAEDDTTVDAGLVVPATISGTVTEDITRDGAGDLPVPGVKVELYADTNGDGQPDGSPIATTTTAPDGSYSFGGLQPGNYVVVETNPTGYVDVSDRDASPDGDPLDTNVVVDNLVPVRLTAGESDSGNNFVDELPAGIQIVKTAGTAADGAIYVAGGTVGETITYHFTVTNNGVATLSNVTVSDPLPGLSAITCGTATNGSIVLLPGASVSCTATYQLTQADIDAGQVLNTGVVTAERPGGNPNDPADNVGDTDPAVVDVPQRAGITIAKATNGVDSDAAPGVLVTPGSPVTWTYTVDNTGNVALADVSVVDDAGTSAVTTDDITATYVSGDTDGDDLLDVTETWVFQATGTAVAGQYANNAATTGTPVDTDGNPLTGVTPPSDDDDDFYFGVAPAIDVQKTVALGAAATCPGGELVKGANGAAVTYCFVITNSGNVLLDPVALNDATLGITLADATYVSGVAPVADVLALAPGESSTFKYSTTIDGDLTNTATVTGTPIDTFTDPQNPTPFDPAFVPAPTDTDTAAVDETPTFSVVKSNDANGDGMYTDTERQSITPAVVPFRVSITNDGADAIVVTSIVDRVDGSVRAFTDLVCLVGTAPVTLPVTLAAGATLTCSFSAMVDLLVDASEVDTISVVATDVDGSDATTKTDTSTVLQPNRGSLAGTVYHDVDGDGDLNTGDTGIAESVVTITPPPGVAIGALAAGEPLVIITTDGTYSVDGLLPGSYTVTVTTLPVDYQQLEDPDLVVDNTTVVTVPAGGSVTGIDFGYVQPSLDIEKSTNGEDADLPLGPFVVSGDTVTWTYVVTNTGVVDVTGVTVTDVPSPGVITLVDDGDGDLVLAPGETWVFEATGVAVDGQFSNTASATGDWTNNAGETLSVTSDEDPSHYYGITAEVDVQKTVASGASATCPGSELVSGANGAAVTYCFVISNTGNTTLTDVTLVDADLGIDLADTTFVSGVALVAGVLALAPGESSTFKYSTTIEGDLTNTVTVSGTPIDTFTDPQNPQDFPDGLIDNPTDTDTAAVDETPTFSVVKSNDANGDGTYTDTENAQSALSTVPFQVVITNTGADPVTFTSITDAVGGVDRTMTGLTCTPVVGQQIPAGGTATCTFTATVDLTTIGTETDTISVTLSDTDGSNPTTTTDTSTVLGESDLQVDKTFVSTADADGDGTFQVVYEVAVTNAGTTSDTYDLSDAPAFDADLVIESGTATAASDGSHVPAQPGGWTSPAWTLASGQLIAPAETHTYTLTFVVDASAVVADPALLSACDPTPVAGSGLFNQATLLVDDVRYPTDACGDLPLLSIDKQGPTLANDLDGDAEIDLGDTLGYTIVVSNVGQTPLTGVTVTDTIIPTLTCVRGGGSAFDHVAGATLAIGESITCTGTYVVVENDVIAGEVTNTATADSNETPPVDDSVTGPIPPAVTIVKSAGVPVSTGGGQYEITYTITVGNTGSAGVYDLTDTLQFGDGITVDSATVVNEVPGTVATNAGWDGATDSTVAAEVAIDYDATHVYVVTVLATVDPAVAIPTGVLCPPPGSGQNGGFANTATVTMDDDTVSDDACVPPPTPDVEIAKRVTSGPTLEDDGTYTIVYQVSVTNISNGVGLYDLVDELQFGGGIDVLSATIANTIPGTITTLATWNGEDQTLAVDNASITAGGVHTYVVTANADALALTTPAAGECSPSEPPTAGGFLNVATVTAGNDTDTADDCVPVPTPELSVAKLVVPASPESNGDGTYTIRYTITVTNALEGPGRYTLNDDLRFGDGVDVLSASVSSSDVAADLSGWAGSGVIASDVAIAGLDTHAYDVVVTATLLPTLVAAGRDCTLGAGEDGTGFLNVVDLQVRGQPVDSDDACVPAPAPAIVVTKTIPAGGFVLNADGTYSVTYDVVVANNGGAPGQYELDDTLTFGAGITISSRSVTGTTPAGLTTNPGWNGVTNVDVTTGPVAIDGTDNADGVQQHVYTIVVSGSASGLASAAAGDCTLQSGEIGTGYLNTALVTVEGATSQDDACDVNPDPAVSVVKDLTAGPTLAADGTYALTYRIVVTNSGGFGSYDLSDAVTFGGGISVVPGSSTVANTVPGTITTLPTWNGVSATAITAGQPIAAGASHTYVVTLRAKVNPVGFDQATDGTCPPPNTGGTGGFLNVATVTSAGQTSSDDACAPTLLPDLALTKQIISGPTDLGDGTYSVVYNVVVTNNGDGVDAYTLDDQLRFGEGITILSAVAVASSPTDIVVDAGWNGVSATRLVTAQPIAGKAVHTYQVTVVADALTVLSVDAAACSTSEELVAGGLLNVATIDSSSLDTIAHDCGEPKLPSITVTKTVGSGPTPVAGQPGVYDITYNVVVANAGPGSGRYDLSDSLAYGTGITIVPTPAPTPRPSVVSSDVTSDLTAWQGSGTIVTDQAIAANATHTYTVRVRAAVAAGTLSTARDCALAGDENGTGLLNRAQLSGPLVEPREVEACKPVPNPSIDVAKSVVSGPTLVSGTTYDISYELVVTNTGLGIGEYDLADTLQFGAGVTVVSAKIASTDVDVTGTTWDGTAITKVIDDVAIPGTSSDTYTVTVRVNVAPGITPAARDCEAGEGEQGTGLLNSVSVTVPGVLVPATDTACGEVPNPSLQVTKSVASGPTRNADGTYTISYTVVATNTGNGPGVYDLVDVPAFGSAITIVSATASSSSVTLSSPQVWNPAAGATLVASGVAITAGQSQTYTLSFVVSIDGPVLKSTAGNCTDGHTPTESEFFNQVNVVADGQVATDDACAPPPGPALTLSKSVSPTTLTPSADGIYDVVFTLTVGNTGDGPTSYTLTDTFAFAAGVEVLSVDVTSKPASATLVAGYDGASNNVVATSPLPAKSTHTYTIAVKVKVTGVTDEQAFDCSLQPGETGTGLLNRSQVNPTAEACVEIPKFADLELTKAVSASTVDVGSNVTYTIYVTNRGPANAAGVSVRDVLPTGVTYVSHTGTGSYDPVTGMWTIGDLAVNAAATLQITVKVTAEATITNTAEVWTSSLPDPDSTPGNGVPSEDDQGAVPVTGRALVAVEPPAPPPATLPKTGGNAGGPVTAAAWLLLGGAALVTVAARRRRTPVADV